MTDLKPCPLLELAERRLNDDADHMVATGDDLAWLIAQLACWPTRVHPDNTTNMSFLMLSASATLLAALRAQSSNSRKVD